MRKVVLGLLVLLSVDGECMKLSMCKDDPEAKEFLVYRLLKVAPDATVNEVVNWVEEGTNSLRPSLEATPASVPVTGVGSSCVTCNGMAATSAPVFAAAVDAPTDVGESLRSLLERLRLVEDERERALAEHDEAQVMLSRLQAELSLAASERDRLREAFAARDSLMCKGYCPDGSNLIPRYDVEVGFMARDTLWSNGYRPDGVDLPAKDYVDAAFGCSMLFEDAGNSYAHLDDISLRLWRAVHASGLKVDMGVLRDGGNALAKPETVDTDDKMKDLPKDQGLTVADLQSATHDHDMVKFALLRGFFNSATYANHDQAALDAVNDVHCDDGAGGRTDVSLGAGGLGLKVTH